MPGAVTVIIVVAMIAGGSLGGVAYHDGVFTAIPLTDLNADMVNDTVTVKGYILFDANNNFGFQFRGASSGGHASASFNASAFFRMGTWCVMNDSKGDVVAYALVDYPDNATAPKKGEPWVVTGKLICYAEISNAGRTIKLAYISSDNYHKPLLFR